MTRKEDRPEDRLTTISARIPLSKLREIQNLAHARGIPKSTMVRNLLDIGMKETKLRAALNLVRQRKISVWKAAKTAGTDYRTMLAALRTSNVPFPLSERDLELELSELNRDK